jgi:UDP:flavonoid glycosyltransferase YjiC (YdhE family)
MPDQYWYGRRTAAIGAGIALNWRHRDRLGGALDDLLDNQRYTRAATNYRVQLAAEDGVAETCDALEALLTDRPRSGFKP